MCIYQTEPDSTYPVENLVDVPVRVNSVTNVVGALVIVIVVPPTVSTVLEGRKVLMEIGWRPIVTSGCTSTRLLPSGQSGSP